MRMDGTVAGSVLGATGNYSKAGSVSGSENVTVQQREPPPSATDRGLDLLRRYVSVLVVGLLLLWLTPRMLRGAAVAVRRRPLIGPGLGGLGFIWVVVAAGLG